MQYYEAVILPPCAVQIHYNNNGDDGCVFIFVECMERCRVGRVRTVGAFVLLVYAYACI